MTTPLLDQGTRALVRSQAELVESLVEKSEDERPSLDEKLRERRERRIAWYHRLYDALFDLVNALPAGTEDYESLQLFKLLAELRLAMDEDTKVIDKDARVSLTAMKMGDVVRRLARRVEHSVLENPDEAARFVLAQLSELPVTDIARLLGVTTKTVGSWRGGSPVRQKAGRVKLVAQLVSYLRYSMTPTGMLMWFENEADMLNGRSPIQVLDESVSSAWMPLISYARGGRAQLAG